MKNYLTLERQTLVDIANAIRSKTDSDKAIKIEDLDDAIGEIESGGGSGGGSVMLERPGIQPVPREGYVEKIQFNTNLNVEEVKTILRQLEYDDSGEYYIYSNIDGSKGAVVYIAGSDRYNIAVSDFGDLFVSNYNNTYDSNDNPWTSCWNPEWKEEYGEINDEVVPSIVFDDYTITFGAQNDLLFDLVYIEGKSISKKLTGTYAATELEITENGIVDILPMIDNKEIPVSVEVDVPMPEIEGELIKNGAVEYQSPATEKIYINTSLSKEEVVEMIKDLPYTNTSHSWLMSPCYLVYTTMTTRENRPGMTFFGNSLYIQRPENQDYNYRICIGNIDTSTGLNYGEEIFNSADGWINTDSYLNEDGSIKDEYLSGSLPVINNGNVDGWDINSDLTVDTFNGAHIYTENGKLTDLIYVKETVTISKILQGTYQPVELEIIESGTIDVLEMIDNQEIPVSVEVNISSSAVIERLGRKAVPNEGYVDKVVFDTSLSTEEVVSILSQLEYDATNTAYIFTNNNIGVIVGSFDGQYVIANLTDLDNMIFDSANGGWSTDFNGEIEVNSELVSEGEGPSGNTALYGTQNESLLKLIYIPIVGSIVPQNTILPHAYLNINLTPDEVDAELDKLNICYDGGYGYLLANDFYVGGRSGNYVIMMRSGGNTVSYLYSSTPENYTDENGGWSKYIGNMVNVEDCSFKTEISGNINTIPGMGYVSDSNILPVASQNHKITKLFSASPFTESKPIPVTASGAYVGDGVVLNKNTTINIADMISKDKRIPLTVTADIKNYVDIRTGGLPVYNYERITDVYFNTSLSTEEVLEIVEPLQNIFNANGEYVLLASDTDATAGRIYYNGAIMLQHGSSSYTLFDPTSGWADTDAKWGSAFGHSIGHIVLHEDNIGFKYIAAHAPGDQLIDLISLTPSFGEYSEATLLATNNYDGSPITITENGEIDIAAMINEGKLPLKIKVNI